MSNIVTDIRKLQEALEKIYQSSVNYNGISSSSTSSNTNIAHHPLKEDIRILLDVLQCPVFESIINIEYSLQQLKEQTVKYPQLLPTDFDISSSTLELNLNVPNNPDDSQPISTSQNHRSKLLINENSNGTVREDQHSKKLPNNDRQSLHQIQQKQLPQNYVKYSSDDVTNNNNQFDYDNRTIPSKFSLQKYLQDHDQIDKSGQNEPDYVNITLQDDAFIRGINELAQGRRLQPVEFYKPEGQSLGFKVVGLNDDTKKLGIYIQEIHENGIAARNGLLQPGDQILAIDQHLFTNDLSHEDAINILQNAKGSIRLMVAKAASLNKNPFTNVTKNPNKSSVQIKSSNAISTIPKIAQQNDEIKFDQTKENKFDENQSVLVDVKRSASDASDSSKDSSEMVINSEWVQIECIEMENDGSGLGFGIVGGRTSGVVVKTIVPGGPAAKDNRLKICDHILRINGLNMRGMSSDQVAQILRQSVPIVKLIVARPVDPAVDLQMIQNTLTIVPTKSIIDPFELEKQIQLLSLLPSNQESHDLVQEYPDQKITDKLSNEQFSQPNPISQSKSNEQASLINLPPNVEILNDPEHKTDMRTFDVELIKDQQGLGITIAGYVCEKVAEEISGIFIKSIAPDSVADKCRKIQINDQIIEVDGESLYGYTNLQAVDLLRNTGKIVKLKLARYIKGSNDRLKTTDSISDPHLINRTSYNKTSSNGVSTIIQINSSGLNSSSSYISPYSLETLSLHKSDSELFEKWSAIVGPEYDVIIASVTKFCHDGGLGISLEGTIDIQNGKEALPHHFINSILPNGPVGRNGLIKENDELLEVNGVRLHGLKHSDVLPLLKDLPIEVRLVCARLKQPNGIANGVESANEKNLYQTHKLEYNPSQFSNTLDMNNVCQPSFIERLVKAKSDGSLAISPIASITSCGVPLELSKLRSRSLEPMTGLAMWSNEPQIIKLIKGDRGLGFSILDYQDPMNPNDTVIVIRSLVPGGIAQQDGRLLPGDRLLFVNDQNLENATLDQAVQALKGAPKGVVIVGVAKPLPLPDTALYMAEIDDVKNSSSPQPISNKESIGKDNFDKNLEEKKDDDNGVDSGSVEMQTQEAIKLDRSDNLIFNVEFANDRLEDLKQSQHQIDYDNELGDEKSFNRFNRFDVEASSSSSSSSIPCHNQHVTSRINQNEKKLQIECNRFDASGNSVITTSSLLDNQFQIKNKNFNDSNQYRNHSIQLTNYSSPSLSKFTIDSEKIMTNHNDPNENSDDEDAQKHSTATNKEQIESDQIDFDGTKRLNQSIESIILMDEKFVPKSIANQTDCNLGVRPESRIKFIIQLNSMRSDSIDSRLLESRTNPFDHEKKLNFNKSFDWNIGEQSKTMEAENRINLIINNDNINNDTNKDRNKAETLKVGNSKRNDDDDDNDDQKLQNNSIKIDDHYHPNHRHHHHHHHHQQEQEQQQQEQKQRPEQTTGTIRSSITIIDRNVRWNNETMTKKYEKIPPIVKTMNKSVDNDGKDEINCFHKSNARISKIFDNKIHLNDLIFDSCDNVDDDVMDQNQSLDQKNHIEIFSILEQNQCEWFGSIRKQSLRKKTALLNINPIGSRPKKIATILIDQSLGFDSIINDENKNSHNNFEMVFDCNHSNSSNRICDKQSATNQLIEDILRSSPESMYLQDSQSNFFSIDENADERKKFLELFNSKTVIVNSDGDDEKQSSFKARSKSNRRFEPNKHSSIFSTMNKLANFSLLNKIETNLFDENLDKQFNDRIIESETIKTKSSDLSMKEDVEKHRRRENLNQKLEENDELAMKKSIRFGLIRASLLNKTNLDDNSVEYRIRIDKTDIDKSSPEDIIEVDEARFSSKCEAPIEPKLETVQYENEPMLSARIGSSDSSQKQADKNPIDYGHLDRQSDPNDSSQSHQQQQQQQQQQHHPHRSHQHQQHQHHHHHHHHHHRHHHRKEDEDNEDVRSSSKRIDFNVIQDANEEIDSLREKIKKKYGEIEGDTILVDLHKGIAGLGISLAGNRDRTKMSVFICGMHPKGSAFLDGRLKIGDEILEVNGIALNGRSHLNASAIIKSLSCSAYRIIVLRRDGASEEMAVKPLTQFPVHLEDFLEEKYCKYKGVRTITVRKATQGLGIMIIEGKRADVGRGVFVSDIQDGSPAENAGLSVGDMILCVNQTDLIGADYETAANVLKCADGLLTLIIAKPVTNSTFKSLLPSSTIHTNHSIVSHHSNQLKSSQQSQSYQQQQQQQQQQHRQTNVHKSINSDLQTISTIDPNSLGLILQQQQQHQQQQTPPITRLISTLSTITTTTSTTLDTIEINDVPEIDYDDREKSTITKTSTYESIAPDRNVPIEGTVSRQPNLITATKSLSATKNPKVSEKTRKLSSSSSIPPIRLGQDLLIESSASKKSIALSSKHSTRSSSSTSTIATTQSFGSLQTSSSISNEPNETNESIRSPLQELTSNTSISPLISCSSTSSSSSSSPSPSPSPSSSSSSSTPLSTLSTPTAGMSSKLKPIQELIQSHNENAPKFAPSSLETLLSSKTNVLSRIESPNQLSNRLSDNVSKNNINDKIDETNVDKSILINPNESLESNHSIPDDSSWMINHSDQYRSLSQMLLMTGHHHHHHQINQTMLKEFLLKQEERQSCIDSTKAAALAQQLIEYVSLDYRTCPIQKGSETTIEIVKEKMGLGLSIVGGCDTPLNAVIIQEIYANGAADVDGRLKPGDQILEISGENLRNATHHQAIKALRQTPPVIRMKIYRDNPSNHLSCPSLSHRVQLHCNSYPKSNDENDYDDDDDEKEEENRQNYLQIFETKLLKKQGKGLGLSVAGRKNGPGIFIKEILNGGIAQIESQLMIGDQILEVNGFDLTRIDQKDAALLLKTAKGIINLKIGRLHSVSLLRKPITICSANNSNTSGGTSENKFEMISSDDTKIIELYKGPNGFGFSIVGGYESMHGNLPICVSKIIPNGSASIDGRLQKGDILLTVNGIDLNGLTHDEVVDILKNIDGECQLLILNGR